MDKVITIEDRKVGMNEPVFVIAEAGFNHNGFLQLALELVDAAAEAGASAIKFQSFTPDELLHHTVDYRDLFEKAYLPPEAYAAIAERARMRRILFGSTPFDSEWVRILDDTDAAFLKIASMDITNYALLEDVATVHRPVILSTGLSNSDEVAKAVEVLTCAGTEDLILLHCVSLYPTPHHLMNLRAIRTLETLFNLPVGFSDHTRGDSAAIMAVAAGALVIEKHFTIDKKLPGPDHADSLDPIEFKKMVEHIRETEIALGDGAKRPCDEELELCNKTRRGIVLRKAIKKGECITRAHLKFLRPIFDGGISANNIYEICGKRIKRNAEPGEILMKQDID